MTITSAGSGAPHGDSSLSSHVDEEVAQAFLQVTPHMGRILRRSLANLSGGMSVMRYRVLMELSRGDSRTTDLARELGVSPPTMSELIDQMVRAGWVKREINAGDRRAVILAITPGGKAELEQAERVALTKVKQVVSRMDEDDARALRRGLEALKSAINALQAEEGS